MKKIVLSFVGVVFYLSLLAQDCMEYKLLTEGAEWQMKTYDKKDKEEGVIDYKILKAYEDGGEKKWDAKMNMKDADEESINEVEFTMSCTDGVFKMSSFTSVNLSSMQDMGQMDMEVDAGDIEYPSDMTVGTKLADAQMNMKFSMNGMQVMSTDVLIKDREVLAYEDITVPAGTYKAYKITQTTEVKSAFVKTESVTIDYYVPGFGAVKSEHYDKKGKLEGYSLLTKYSAN